MLSLLEQYSLREKLIVGLGLLILVVLGIHAFVIEPYRQRVADLQQEIEQQHADLAWMRTAVSGLPAAGSGISGNRISGSLANYIDQAVRRQGLSGQLSQMSPVGSDEIRMRYNAVEFNRLVGFIAQISSGGLDVKDIRISAADSPGIVDSSLAFVRR